MTVSPLQGITHACFGLSYGVALLLELAHLLWPRRAWRAAAVGFGAAGLLAHTAYLLYHRPTPAAPYGSLLLLAWVLAVFYLYGTVHHARQAWAVFVLPVVIGLVGLSLLLFAADTARAPAPVDVPAWLSGERFWGVLHGVLILLASVGISVGFLASVMYLVQARRLRNKANPFGGFRLLSLERLEAMNRRALNAAFPLLTAGVLLGTVLLRHDGTAAGEWLVGQGAQHGRAVGGVPGRCSTCGTRPTSAAGGWRGCRCWRSACCWSRSARPTRSRRGVGREPPRRRVQLPDHAHRGPREARLRPPRSSGAAWRSSTPGTGPRPRSSAPATGSSCTSPGRTAGRRSPARWSPSSWRRSTACRRRRSTPHLYEHADAGGRPPPVPGGRQPGQPGGRRGADRRPGEGRVRAGAEARGHRAAAERPVPDRAAGREARPHRDRHRRRATCRCRAWRSITCGRCSTTSRTRRCW